MSNEKDRLRENSRYSWTPSTWTSPIAWSDRLSYSNYQADIRRKAGAAYRIYKILREDLSLSSVRNIFLVLDLLDRELVQPDLFSDPLTTSGILGTGLVSEECVDLQTDMRKKGVR
jgi:hypothetical protein